MADVVNVCQLSSPSETFIQPETTSSTTDCFEIAIEIADIFYSEGYHSFSDVQLDEFFFKTHSKECKEIEKNPKNELESLTDEDLKTLMRNFGDLRKYEQKILTNLLMKIDREQPERGEGLRNFQRNAEIDLELTNQNQHNELDTSDDEEAFNDEDFSDERHHSRTPKFSRNGSKRFTPYGKRPEISENESINLITVTRFLLALNMSSYEEKITKLLMEAVKLERDARFV